MPEINFKNCLTVLSKSSPYSVCTLNDSATVDDLSSFKDYLYVKNEVEKEFEKILESLSKGNILFLCGSSGDGKSEILTRHYATYHDNYSFYLDATHSFSPHQSAIEALDNLFDKSIDDQKPLIIGINIGMLANYANEGQDRHSDIKSAIESFLQKKPYAEGMYYFLNFEQYPKFDLSKSSGSYSAFAKELMRKLTSLDGNNPFYSAAKRDEDAGQNLMLIANFKLLGYDSVQDIIINNMLKTRLFKDQFITTRALLDFFYNLLTGKEYLFDNLFCCTTNELIQCLSDFDPALKHTRNLDQFVLRYELGLPDVKLDDFLNTLRSLYISFSRTELETGRAASLIRLFYLLRNESLGNNYHETFRDDFNEELLIQFARIWMLHNEYNGSNEHKHELRQFYVKELINAVFLYANRNASELINGDLFLGKYGPVKLAAQINLKCDYEAINKNKILMSSRFYAYLKVSDKALDPVDINLNLFELVYKLNRGYRPNKYDKNAIVLLDELIEQITNVAKSSSELKFCENNNCYVASQDDGMINTYRVP